ncbi:grpb/dephospho-CoA kinase [Lipomyces tetrasporus]|uniref:Grpb/dephospho-CoA kinase n=1 Tax=Lipomyces tetrasporus TaxID=54092 RepID=A0AAD7QNX4_9ASCO|nr:grpb/dephospho-CoA kinase [Lipomyces tetrasporus]KAJ8098892.1 grpb/dephospho-CoA kinase [Lipomyces tetrasporus]
MKVVVEPHNPAWIVEFSNVKAALEIILKDVPPLSIEHVGSTSVPGLPAKPILDIDIIVTPETLASTRQALVQAGYFDCGEMNVPGRFAFRQPGFGQNDAAFGEQGKAPGEMRRNTYAVIEGCVALRNHLDIKRTLLSDEGLRDEYGQVKMALAAKEWANIGEYVTSKNEILWKILERAGWSGEDLDEVKKANT